MVDFLKRKNVRVSELLAHTERGDRRKALDHLSRGLVRVHALQRMSVALYHYYEMTLCVLCSTLQVHVLASTDMASRGLDLSRLTHVFNYEVPPSARHYLHRAGRAGREGRTGTVVTVVCNAEEVECVPWCKTNTRTPLWRQDCSDLTTWSPHLLAPPVDKDEGSGEATAGGGRVLPV